LNKSGKILVAALGGISTLSPTEATSRLARGVRAIDTSIESSRIVQLPIVDGGSGTIDFLVTNTLGSFLEVEATGATGEEIVVPIGFAGDDGKLAVIEMSRVAHIASHGAAGTTAGVGELIQDALDEGAFSILLGHEEPIACDAGLGAAAALGVKYFDANGAPVPSILSARQLSQIDRIDVSGRSFSLLSSRIYIARSKSASNSSASEELLAGIDHLSEIIRRDVGVPAPHKHTSASGIEFGLVSLIGAEVRDGLEVVIEASRIAESIERGEFSTFILLAPSLEALNAPEFQFILKNISSHIARGAVILTRQSLGENGSQAGSTGPREIFSSEHVKIYSLSDVKLFQRPIYDDSNTEEVLRDIGMRLDKILPIIMESL
jgi:glycerate 2-kinase